jgi:hypothetical protein
MGAKGQKGVAQDRSAATKRMTQITLPMIENEQLRLAGTVDTKAISAISGA